MNADQDGISWLAYFRICVYLRPSAVTFPSFQMNRQCRVYSSLNTSR